MKLSLISAAELSDDLVLAWSEIQQSQPGLCSPYFRPEFTQAVADIRRDVEVAVIRDGKRPVGFFPFHRLARGVGIPIGGSMSDYHGVVCRPNFRFSALELIRSCGLVAWEFDHLPAWQEAFREFSCLAAASPYIDLSRGAAAYEAERGRSGSETIRKIGSKGRKMAREIGPLRLETDSRSRPAFDTLVRWKAEQYRRTGMPNVFTPRWTLALLNRVFDGPQRLFRGVLSVLYAGERIVAVQFDLRSGAVLHGWFCAYDKDLSRYSPGCVLLLELIRAAGGLGIARIDMGKGDSQFKRSFMSGQTPLVEGVVDSCPVRRQFRRAWGAAVSWARRSPLREPGRRILSALRPFSTWMAMRRELSRAPR